MYSAEVKPMSAGTASGIDGFGAITTSEYCPEKTAHYRRFFLFYAKKKALLCLFYLFNKIIP